jgi:large subunit ribosomal protein L32
MAVPKKRTSKQKKNSRKTTWRQKAGKEALKALSLAKSVLTGNSKKFIYRSSEIQKTKIQKSRNPEIQKSINKIVFSYFD